MAAERSGVSARRRVVPSGSQRPAAGGARSIVALQRKRLLSGAVGVLAEQGYAGFTAAAVCERCGVSRRTFYEVFENREQCLAAILVDARQRARDAIADLELNGLSWSDRVRLGLWTILCLADSDPALARVCIVECRGAGEEIRRERQRIVSGLVDALDEGRTQSTGASTASRLTAEALVGAISSVIATRLTRAYVEDGNGGMGVRGLLGELTGMIVLPYQGPAAARRQMQRALPDTPALTQAGSAGYAEGPDPLASLPIRLTYRTAQVLQAVAKLTATDASASNRQIAEHAGISDAGQASRLLGRLQQHGLLQNDATGSRERGEANRWHLTQAGRQVVQSISPEAGRTQHRSAA